MDTSVPEKVALNIHILYDNYIRKALAATMVMIAPTDKATALVNDTDALSAPLSVFTCCFTTA